PRACIHIATRWTLRNQDWRFGRRNSWPTGVLLRARAKAGGARCSVCCRAWRGSGCCVPRGGLPARKADGSRAVSRRSRTAIAARVPQSARLGEALDIAMEPVSTYAGEPTILALVNFGTGLALIGADERLDSMVPRPRRFVF